MAISLVLLLTGCFEEKTIMNKSTVEKGVDTSTPEVPDTETPDPDTQTPEVPDTETPDPDTQTPEVPDTETPDPDTQTPEVPDTETPDPDTQTPEVPDTETPDPDTQTPEVPDTETPDPDTETPEVPDALTANIELSKTSETMPLKTSFYYHATLVDPDGKRTPLASSSVQWQSTDSEVASIDSEGLVATHIDGETNIIASYDGIEVEAKLNVSDDFVSGFSGLVQNKETLPWPVNDVGLPLYESNPGAPITLFIDYDGGTYLNSSRNEIAMGGYNRTNSDPNTFDAQEQADILASLDYLHHYFAMFDINVTTIESVRDNSKAWSWIIITEDKSGGSGVYNTIARWDYARAWVGSSTVRIENSDKSRRVAHEMAHNFNLRHSGVWVTESSECRKDDPKLFCKWEDYHDWDRKYGPIMGGGGKGKRNGWSNDPNDKGLTVDDRMATIRSKITKFDSSTDGWRHDDFDNDKTYALNMDENGGAFVDGILGSPDDIDTFKFTWGGGDLIVEGKAVSVSAALLNISIFNSEKEKIWQSNEITNDVYLSGGIYTIQVKSQGGYGEIGSYRLSLDPK